MSSTSTITWSDISTLKSSISEIKSKIGNGVAIYTSKDYETAVKPITNLSFILMETEVTFDKTALTADINTPQIANSKWASSINNKYFIVLSDIKSSPTDTQTTYSSALHDVIKTSSKLAWANQKIGEVKRDNAKSGAAKVIVDILFIGISE
jgi:hypothetical protein